MAFQPFSMGGRNCMGGKYVSDETLSSVSPFPLRFCIFYILILDDRVFLAEARLILSKMVWNFDLEMADPDDWNWLDHKAYLVFEPKALMVKLKEVNALGYGVGGSCSTHWLEPLFLCCACLPMVRVIYELGSCSQMPLWVPWTLGHFTVSPSQRPEFTL